MHKNRRSRSWGLTGASRGEPANGRLWRSLGGSNTHGAMLLSERFRCSLNERESGNEHTKGQFLSMATPSPVKRSRVSFWAVKERSKSENKKNEKEGRGGGEENRSVFQAHTLLPYKASDAIVNNKQTRTCLTHPTNPGPDIFASV